MGSNLFHYLPPKGSMERQQIIVAVRWRQLWRPLWRKTIEPNLIRIINWIDAKRY